MLNLPLRPLSQKYNQYLLSLDERNNNPVINGHRERVYVATLRINLDDFAPCINMMNLESLHVYSLVEKNQGAVEGKLKLLELVIFLRIF